MLYSVVGYGTFITKGFWKHKLNVEVCLVKHFIRIYINGFWFPFALPHENSSFKALKFDVNKVELNELDHYEGVSSNLFERAEITILLKDKTEKEAYIYIPTRDTIERFNLNPNLDKKDRWKDEIKKIPDLSEKFPALLE